MKTWASVLGVAFNQEERIQEVVVGNNKSSYWGSSWCVKSHILLPCPNLPGEAGEVNSGGYDHNKLYMKFSKKFLKDWPGIGNARKEFHM